MPLPSGVVPDAVRLLLVDGDAAQAAALTAELRPCFARLPAIVSARAGGEAVELLRANAYDVLLMDIESIADLAPASGDAVARLVKFADGALTIALSGDGSVSAAVAAMRAGAHDFAARPIETRKLAARIGELAHRHGKVRLAELVPETPGIAADLSEFIGASARMAAIGALIGQRPDGRPHLPELVRRLSALLAAGTVTPDMLDAAAAEAGAGRGAAGRTPVMPMWRQEQRIIEDAIASFSGNIALAAAALELSPSTIYRKRQAWLEADNRRGAA
jgi:DNA-binding NtrC family response regulator